MHEELRRRRIRFEEQEPLEVQYKRITVGEYLADFAGEDRIILELKAVSTLNEAHKAQALHYLAATGYRLAILLNFGAQSLQQKRVVRQEEFEQFVKFVAELFGGHDAEDKH